MSLFFYKNGNSWVLGETANSFMPTGKYFLKEYDATHVDIYPVDRNVYVAYWAQRDVTTIKKNEEGDFYASKVELLGAVSDFFADASALGGDAATLQGHNAAYFQTALGFTPEQAGVADGLITSLKDGVSTEGNTLKKLYDLIVSSYSEVTKATIAERDAYNVTKLPTSIFVTDAGDGKWALYKATSIGVGVNFILISDPDLLNAVMTGSQVAAAYEGVSGVNRFTDALKSKVDAIDQVFTTALKNSYDSKQDGINTETAIDYWNSSIPTYVLGRVWLDTSVSPYKCYFGFGGNWVEIPLLKSVIYSFNGDSFIWSGTDMIGVSYVSEKANRGRVTFSKATYNVPATVSYVAQTGAFTPGTDTPGATLVNLPDASTVPAGQRLVIADESGSIRPWFRLQIAPNLTQTIDGENIYTNLYYPYSMITLISNGLNGWTIENIKPVGTAITSPQGKRSQYCYENELPLGAGNSQPGDIRVNASNVTVAPNSDGIYAVGSAQIPAGTGSGHYGSIVSGGMASSRLRIGNTKNRWVEYNVKIDNLPDATNDAVVRIGFSDSTNTSAPTNGAFFNILRSVDAVNWIIRTTENSSTTTASTAVPFTAGTFQRFGVEIKDDLTAAYFFIDDVLVGTITTNVPTINRQVSTQVAAMWVVGSTTRSITVDRIREHFIVNAANLRVV